MVSGNPVQALVMDKADVNSGTLVINSASLIEMSELIEKLTTSGKHNIDEKTIKQLKKICRLSEDCVRHAFHLIMVQLEKKHAEIRLAAAQIINELFLRSHCFRELLLSNFQHFMELTLEIDLMKPLPAPLQVSKQLKLQCIDFVHNWFLKFGDTYKKLALGYNYLQNCKKIDFINIHARTVAEARLHEERQKKQELLLQNRAAAALEEMNDMAAEIRCSLTEAENCMGLLVPGPDLFDVRDWVTPNTNEEHICDIDSLSMSVIHGLNNNGENSSSTEGQIFLSETTVRSESNKTHINQNENVSDPSHEDVTKCDCLAEGSKADDSKEHKSEPSGDFADTSQSRLKDNLVNAYNISCNQQNCRNDSDEDEESDNGMGSDSENDEEQYEENCVNAVSAREHGILNYKTSMNITVSVNSFAIQETKDNSDVIVTLNDQVTLAKNKFIPSIKRWLEAFTKAGGNETRIKSAIDLKMEIDAVLKKAEKLNVTGTFHCTKISCDSSNSSDDDDFVEVPMKEGYEPYIPYNLREEYGLPTRSPKTVSAEGRNLPHRKKKQELDSEDPTTWAATLKKIKEENYKRTATGESASEDFIQPKPSTSTGDPTARKNREELLKRAPVIPYSTDLYHWGESIEVPLMVRNDTESATWWIKQDLEDKVDVQALASIRQRRIDFVGKFEPVQWQCRARLPSGELCVRMDRKNCPFHGKIIPRDKTGVPNGPSKDEKEASSSGLQPATGVSESVEMKKGKGTGKRKNREKKYPNLTDIKSLNKNTARKRLESKILNNASVKRVAESLNELDAKRHKDKFGNNFNYSCQM